MALKRNLISNYLGQGWVALMSLAFIPLYIKYLGMEAYGLIGLFALLQAWLSLLDMGMTPTLGREMARFTAGSHSKESIRDLLRSIEILAITVAVLMAGGIALAANWIATDWLRAETLSTELVALAFTMMGVVTALRFVEGVFRSAIVGLQQQLVFNVINGFMATLRGAGAVGVMMWVSPTIDAFFLWQVVVSIVNTIMLRHITYRYLPICERIGRFSLDALRPVWSFAGGMMAITFLAVLLTQIDKILLTKLLTLSEFGYYVLASTVASSLYVLIGPITQAYSPKFCQLYELRQHSVLVSTYHQAAQMVSIVAGSLAIVIFLFSETILRLWTQDVELAIRVAPLLSALILGNLLNGFMWVPYQAQLAFGWTSLAMWTNFVAIIVIVPTILLIVPEYGVMGAAWIWVILNAGYCLISVHFMYRRILTTEKWNWYKNDLVAPVVAALTSAFVIKLSWPAWSGNISDFLLITVATISTLITALMASKDIRKFIGKLIIK